MSKDQIAISTSKANKMLGVLKNSFISREETLWKKLYTTYVRSQLEFCNQAWCPYLKGDINKIEKVQRRATKTAHSMKSSKYPERLAKLNLTTLEERRVRGDLITFFKINNKLDIINWHNPPKTSAPRANKRGQLRRELVPNCLQRYNFLNNRVAAHWNKLPDHIINSKTLNQFKNKLDQHYRDKNQQHITS